MTESKLKECAVCGDPFKWSEDVVVIDDTLRHTRCVTLHPSGYVAFVGDEYIGETENDNGDMAFEILDDGEFIDAGDKE